MCVWGIVHVLYYWGYVCNLFKLEHACALEYRIALNFAELNFCGLLKIFTVEQLIM